MTEMNNMWRKTMKLRVLLLFCACSFAMAGCATSTPVTSSPLPEAEQEELRCTLLGKWKHTAIDGDPVNYADITWSFQPDGNGMYTQVVKATGQRGTQTFNWRLEGRNIHLNLEKRNKETVYRADEWSQNDMQWFNYRLSDNYTVQRVEDPVGGCT
jgi:hypothetical protein